jgi:hypothetical protein
MLERFVNRTKDTIAVGEDASPAHALVAQAAAPARPFRTPPAVR